MDKKRNGSERPDTIPDWARVTRPPIVTPTFDKGPVLGGNTDKIADAALNEALRQLEKGDLSGLRASYLRAGRKASSLGQAQCDHPHYLDEGDEQDVGNRLSWWTKMPPPTGELSALSPFECEFHPVLRQMIDWEMGQPGGSANTNTAAQFTFVDQPPQSIATIQRLQAAVLTDFDNISRAGEEHNFVMGAVRDGFELDPQQPWPPLTIVFDQSQRAVGIEYGFAGDHAISPQGVELTAYDRQGSELARTRGQFYGNFVRTYAQARSFIALACSTDGAISDTSCCR